MEKLVLGWGHNWLAAKRLSLYSQVAFGLVVEVIEGCGRAPAERLHIVPHGIRELCSADLDKE